MKRNFKMDAEFENKKIYFQDDNREMIEIIQDFIDDRINSKQESKKAKILCFSEFEEDHEHFARALIKIENDRCYDIVIEEYYSIEELFEEYKKMLDKKTDFETQAEKIDYMLSKISTENIQYDFETNSIFKNLATENSEFKFFISNYLMYRKEEEFKVM